MIFNTFYHYLTKTCILMSFQEEKKRLQSDGTSSNENHNENTGDGASASVKRLKC